MHIHLPWLLMLLIPVCSIILLIAIPTEQEKLERTDLKAEFKRKNNLK